MEVHLFYVLILRNKKDELFIHVKYESPNNYVKCKRLYFKGHILYNST